MSGARVLRVTHPDGCPAFSTLAPPAHALADSSTVQGVAHGAHIVLTIFDTPRISRYNYSQFGCRFAADGHRDRGLGEI